MRHDKGYPEWAGQAGYPQDQIGGPVSHPFSFKDRCPGKSLIVKKNILSSTASKLSNKLSQETSGARKTIES
jgi:hypothetical protein